MEVTQSCVANGGLASEEEKVVARSELGVLGRIDGEGKDWGKGRREFGLEERRRKRDGCN